MARFDVTSVSRARPGRVVAVLGPTNTGKTHLAVERMLGHASGVIGLPLRLLAREIYDRVAAAKGARSVALITGEEKIVPPSPRWFVCTVEAMPQDRQFDFLAVDEIQLIGDGERGHVFTDRLLRARGRDETMFLGADTVRGLVRKLAPEAEIVGRARLSRLSYAGAKKLSRLPPRSAIVAFSAAEVYAIAELVRRQMGGAAVVLGALSPRTRNAQVALYQAGEVDYLVATDAIGMGLNMDIDHVAFAQLRKFDGIAPRALTPAEIGQIAGRAGRHMDDGTFGTTADAGPVDADLVERLENHRFDALPRARWRNSALDFATLRDLLRSLEEPAPLTCLGRARDAEDYLALKTLGVDRAIAAVAKNTQAVRLLWRVCQIPDYRKTLHDSHVRLLGRVYRHLTGPDGVLPTDWVARQLSQLERSDGDIDTLSTRLAYVRTWTYISHRAEWLDDARHWQERARAIEDRLSDALHERLTQRFVDRRGALLARRLKDRVALAAFVAADGDVTVEGQYVGRLDGLAFHADASLLGPESRALRAAANRALGPALEARARALADDSDASFRLADDAKLLWRDAALAWLVRGDSALAPRLRMIAAESSSAGARNLVERRLADWLDRQIARTLAPLVRLGAAKLAGPARGIAFQLTEGLGALPRFAAQDQIAALTASDGKQLKGLGVRIGEAHVFMPALLKPAAARLKLILWSARAGAEPLAPPPAGLISPPLAADRPAAWWLAAGYALIGGRAVRLDMLERIAVVARRQARAGPFAAGPALQSLLGRGREDVARVLVDLGYRRQGEGEFERFKLGKQRHGARPVDPVNSQATSGRGNAASPFARLKELSLG